MNNKIIVMFLSLFLLMQGCRDVERGPISSGSNIPGNITDVTVKNIAGGAEISYTIPSDNDLLYVKAVYTIESGKQLEVKASLYEKSLAVKGFNTIDNTREFPVTVTCVNRANNESAPVQVMIQPEMAPIQKVKNSFSISATWGGAMYQWTNEDQEPVTIIFLADTVTAESAKPAPMVGTRVINTKIENGSYTSRGFPDKPRKFAVLLRDNYGNTCDTIKPESVITPLLEMKLDKKPMHVLEYGETPVEDLWNVWSSNAQWLIDDIHDDNNNVVCSYQTPFPRFITVDFNRLVILSRYVMWQRTSNNNNGRNEWMYAYGNPKTWVLYVRSEPIVLSQEITADNDGDGLPDWTNFWTKVGEVWEMPKPSGLPGSQKTEEDIEFVLAGISFDLPMELGPVRYFRLGVLTNYEDAGWVNWQETDFYGIDTN